MCEQMELRAKRDKTRENTIMPLVTVPQTCQALTYRHAFALDLLAAPMSANPCSPFKVQLMYLTAFPHSCRQNFCIFLYLPS